MLDQNSALKNGQFIKGDSYRWALQFVNRGVGTPVDLTGLTLIAKLNLSESVTVLGQIIAIDWINGKIAVDFTANSADMEVGVYSYALLAIDQSGYSLTLVQGCIEVLSKVTADCCEEVQYA